MINRKTFFDGIRSGPFPGKLTKPQVEGVNVLLDEYERHYANLLLSELAYILATTKWETAHTMQPIPEIGRGKGRRYGKPDPETGQIYYGRGYVQLTWKRNYQAMEQSTNLDLVNQPDLALQPKAAAEILFAGMILGIFTGKKLANYFGPDRTDFFNARKIVNGLDKAQEIANIAKMFYADLLLAQES